jgi:hypothetical protein
LIGTPLLVCCQVLLGSAHRRPDEHRDLGDPSLRKRQFARLGFCLSGFLVSGVLHAASSFQWLSFFVPARHYINITRDAFVRGAGWPGVWSEVLALH